MKDGFHFRLMANANAILLHSQFSADRFDEQQLVAINPRLILVQRDALGSPTRGPKPDHLGYDDFGAGDPGKECT